MLDDLTLERFAQHLNDLFRVDAGPAGQAQLVLVEATEKRAPAAWEAFSLLFRGPPDFMLPQATYRFQHDALGDFDLFFTPIRRDQLGFYYEAAFNRQRSQEHQ